MKLFEKYMFHPLPRVKLKLMINYKLEQHIIYIATKLSTEIEVRDGIGDDHHKSLV